MCIIAVEGHLSLFCPKQSFRRIYNVDPSLDLHKKAETFSPRFFKQLRLAYHEQTNKYFPAMYLRTSFRPFFFQRKIIKYMQRLIHQSLINLLSICAVQISLSLYFLYALFVCFPLPQRSLRKITHFLSAVNATYLLTCGLNFQHDRQLHEMPTQSAPLIDRAGSVRGISCLSHCFYGRFSSYCSNCLLHLPSRYFAYFPHLSVRVKCKVIKNKVQLLKFEMYEPRQASDGGSNSARCGNGRFAQPWQRIIYKLCSSGVFTYWSGELVKKNQRKSYQILLERKIILVFQVSP